MTDQLSAIEPAKRRKAAFFLFGFAAFFLAVGLVAVLGRTPGAIMILGAVIIAGAVLLALMAWGTLNSVAIDRSQAALDAEIARTVAEHEATCGCGHSHDPDEMITVGCEHDGKGEACAHDCETCALAALRHS